MRLVSFQGPEGTPRVGALHGPDDLVVDFAAVGPGEPAFVSMRTLMAAGQRGLDLAREAVESADRCGALLPLASVRLLNPLVKPTLIRDFATMETHMRNYFELRAIERSRGQPDPQAYVEAERRAGKMNLPPNWLTVYSHHIGNPLNAIGPEDTLVRPRGCAELDYELELAAVIGRPVRDAGEDEARDAIFGYTLMNDFTMRDVQRAEAKAAGKCKDFEGSYSLGPCIVTRDAIGDLAAMRVRSRLNGEQQTEDSPASMKIRFEQLVAYISRSCTVHPGEVFASGTFARGCGFELGRLLADGDVVALEADGIGTLRNRVAGNAAAAH
jgi:2-keto-4-pentenoate hydratase/2-oxohepta-3-ene-1,7-dioic acid hydratase in catechol pathway